jgi:hypothetical protein
MHNILVAGPGAPIYRGGYGSLVQAGGFESDANVIWAEGGKVRVADEPEWKEPRPEALTLEEWRAAGFDARSVVSDPMFVDAGKGDFTLRAGSPAVAAGFRAIDLSKVGPRGK